VAGFRPPPANLLLSTPKRLGVTMTDSWKNLAREDSEPTHSLPEGEHLVWPDALKIAAIYAVILIHSAAPLLLLYDELGAAAWWAGNVYDSLARWCIPAFFMLSGSFLIEKSQGKSLASFFRRRLQRVFVPFLVWSFVYFLWRMKVNGESLTYLDFVPVLLAGPVYYHLWYLYVLIGLYLFVPALTPLLLHGGRQTLTYLLFLWFLLASILPSAEAWFGFHAYLSTGISHSLFKYSGYFVLGYLLRRVTLTGRGLLAASVVFLFGLFLTVYGTYYVTVVKDGGTLNELFYHYFSFNVFLMSVSLYLLAKSVGSSGGPGTGAAFRAVGVVAGCVPGIYLVHALLLVVFRRGLLLGITLTPTSFHPALGTPVFATAIFLASFALVLLLKQVPGLKHAFP
jgi:surface polysaccharide O-acyltransferase-like enzyme